MFYLSETFWYSAFIAGRLHRETKEHLASCSWKYRRLSLEFKLNYKQTINYFQTKLNSINPSLSYFKNIVLIGLLFFAKFIKQNQVMIYQHNQSTLLGSKRRAVYYPPTGTGRDTYIMTDNGGTNITYRCQGVPQLGNYMKFGPNSKTYKPCSYTRFQKYISDGSGRDQYVVSHHGGQYNQQDECNLKLRKFRDTMRDGGWKKNNTETGWRVSKEAQRERAISEYQRNQSSRLSAPKRIGEKYQQKLIQMRKTFYPSINQ